MDPASQVPGAGPHARSVARSGTFSLAGAVVSAVMGFALILVLARTLGTGGSGIVLQSIAAFTIALSVARAGLDTTAVWLLPRLADDQTRTLRPAIVGLLAPALALGTVVAVGLWLVGGAFADRSPPLAESIMAMVWFLPFATVMTVGLSATRGLGGVRPYVLIGSMAVPTARPLLLLAVSWLAAGTLAASLAWVAPLPIAAAVTVLLLARTVRRRERDAGVRGPFRPDRSTHRRIWGYALPRSVSTVLEQTMQWLDVLLVGILAGPAAAGIYGAATRFVGAGLILSTALRIVVAPMYSRLLGLTRAAEVQALYTTTTKWIVLFSTPVYVVFALFGGTVLGFLGPGFRPGAPALAVLSIGMLVVLLAGNVQALLLMSGHSGRAAVNKAVALTVNVIGLIVLVPPFGIEGAAVAWSVSMVVDAGLAAYQVRQLVGVRVGGRGVATALAVGAVSFGIPALVSRLALGDTATALAVAVWSGMILLALAGVLLRQRLDLGEILTMLRLRRSPPRGGRT